MTIDLSELKLYLVKFNMIKYGKDHKLEKIKKLIKMRKEIYKQSYSAFLGSSKDTYTYEDFNNLFKNMKDLGFDKIDYRNDAKLCLDVMDSYRVIDFLDFDGRYDSLITRKWKIYIFTNNDIIRITSDHGTVVQFCHSLEAFRENDMFAENWTNSTELENTEVMISHIYCFLKDNLLEIVMEYLDNTIPTTFQIIKEQLLGSV
ncbi:MAG: hypothetical protein PHC62_01020 [Candidatus Izemoplasmatales bacterium]|nr:hypothetical protein [Candidatus Izemoplasmatales bacterium]